MATYTQAERNIRLSTPLGKDVLLLERLTGREALSELFTFRLEMVANTDAPTPIDTLIGQPVSVEIDFPGRPLRYIHGITRWVRECGQDNQFTHFQAEIVPEVWLLTKLIRSRIFQKQTVVDILKEVFKGYPVDFRLSGTFYPHNYCVQYLESDFNFAARMMEEEGIYFFFEFTQIGATLVIANDSVASRPLPVQDVVLYDSAIGGSRKGGRIRGFNRAHEIRSHSYSARDYHLELPTQTLEHTNHGAAKIDLGGKQHGLHTSKTESLFVQDYPGDYAHRFDFESVEETDRNKMASWLYDQREKTVAIRTEEETCQAMTLDGAGDLPHFTPGYLIRVENHFSTNGVVLLKSVEHQATNASYRGSEGADPAGYENTFTAVPSNLRFRPRRATPKPRVHGSQTARVVGPENEQIYTDKFGRVKVLFPWHYDGKPSADASCWVRVAQHWAGKGYGFLTVPRVGEEVIVSFLDADPDNPIITGSVFNADNMPPVQLPMARMQQVIKSHSYSNSTEQKPGSDNCHGIVFNDLMGGEHLQVHSERDRTDSTEGMHFINAKMGHHTHVGSMCVHQVGGWPGRDHSYGPAADPGSPASLPHHSSTAASAGSSTTSGSGTGPAPSGSGAGTGTGSGMMMAGAPAVEVLPPASLIPNSWKRHTSVISTDSGSGGSSTTSYPNPTPGSWAQYLGISIGTKQTMTLGTTDNAILGSSFGYYCNPDALLSFLPIPGVGGFIANLVGGLAWSELEGYVEQELEDKPVHDWAMQQTKLTPALEPGRLVPTEGHSAATIKKYKDRLKKLDDDIKKQKDYMSSHTLTDEQKKIFEKDIAKLEGKKEEVNRDLDKVVGGTGVLNEDRKRYAKLSDDIKKQRDYMNDPSHALTDDQKKKFQQDIKNLEAQRDKVADRINREKRKLVARRKAWEKKAGENDVKKAEDHKKHADDKKKKARDDKEKAEKDKKAADEAKEKANEAVEKAKEEKQKADDEKKAADDRKAAADRDVQDKQTKVSDGERDLSAKEKTLREAMAKEPRNEADVKAAKDAYNQARDQLTSDRAELENAQEHANEAATEARDANTKAADAANDLQQKETDATTADHNAETAQKDLEKASTEEAQAVDEAEHADKHYQDAKKAQHELDHAREEEGHARNRGQGGAAEHDPTEPADMESGTAPAESAVSHDQIHAGELAHEMAMEAFGAGLGYTSVTFGYYTSSVYGTKFDIHRGNPITKIDSPFTQTPPSAWVFAGLYSVYQFASFAFKLLKPANADGNMVGDKHAAPGEAGQEAWQSLMMNVDETLLQFWVAMEYSLPSILQTTDTATITAVKTALNAEAEGALAGLSTMEKLTNKNWWSKNSFTIAASMAVLGDAISLTEAIVATVKGEAHKAEASHGASSGDSHGGSSSHSSTTPTGGSSSHDSTSGSGGASAAETIAADFWPVVEEHANGRIISCSSFTINATTNDEAPGPVGIQLNAISQEPDTGYVDIFASGTLNISGGVATYLKMETVADGPGTVLLSCGEEGLIRIGNGTTPTNSLVISPESNILTAGENILTHNEDGFIFLVGDTQVAITEEGVEIHCGAASFTMSPDTITLEAGGSTLNLSSAGLVVNGPAVELTADADVNIAGAAVEIDAAAVSIA